ncbi:hypothetical protein [Gymnodinialimonas ceratoperidinii]|uniref:Uncharacterized protein n=1 Tax=Gymnodinialimonas ceratoperidinii TaxID=2856823 RepID=A0A8F6TTY5_9RHOB|nr:hypothetical protein [Gymnodinialimonas ceratoperidinii]QXT38906.1 hypothetical protein KYE46_13315 [Gymnodinialimonas ceratoperidinii]
MKKLFAAAFALIATAGIAAACPAWQNQGVQTGYTTGQDLWTPNHYSVTAGGNQSLRNCGWNHSGHVISRPDFEFTIDGLEAYRRLEIRVNGSCDTVLLVNDSSGNWHFNDDGWGNLNPLLNVHNPRSGVFDIWVGTYGTNLCGATLQMETF